jgi:hypothetical protein
MELQCGAGCGQLASSDPAQLARLQQLQEAAWGEAAAGGSMADAEKAWVSHASSWRRTWLPAHLAVALLFWPRGDVLS